MRSTQGTAETVNTKLKEKKMKINLVVKVTAIMAVSIILVSAITNLMLYNLSYRALENEIKDKIKLLASTSAAAIDGDELTTVQAPEDEGNETYLKLQKKLQDIKKDSMGKIRYIYTIKKTGGQYTYVMDAEPIGDKKNHSSVGDPFSVQEYPVAAEGFSKPSVENDPVPDEEFGGITQSGYAPVRDKAGNIVGALGVDIDVSVLLKDQTELRQAGITVLIFALLLALLLGVFFSRYLTKPILALTRVTKRVAEGDLGISVAINRNDELGQLGISFNSMINDLNLAHTALKKYNLELEDKVAQRTAALSEINKEIRDILDNISQAIFTIDDRLRFNPQYSKFASHIFGDVSFEDKSMLDIFFPMEGQESLRENMALWLKKAFSCDATGWDNLEALQPVKEIMVHTDGGDSGQVKYVKINFKPIAVVPGPGLKTKVSKIMLIVQDITEKKSLQREMFAKEKEYKDNINQIVEIIKMDHELFQDFITECRDSLARFEPMLIQLKDDMGNMDLVNDLSRIMHTIKGNAKSFNLERIAGEAHSIENIFSPVRKGEKVLTDSLLDELFKRLDSFNALFGETMDIFDKIVNSKNTGIGTIHMDKRSKDESEVIKVKVNDIDRLAELISRADALILSGSPAEPAVILGPEKAREVEDVFRETGEQLRSIRKVTFGRLSARFPRVVRDVSMELGKKVRFIASGEDLRVDKYIFDNLSEPLIHIIRNSLDHGIETPGERIKSGKAEEGLVRLDIFEAGKELVVKISDDGRGIDCDRIKAKAVTNGLIPAESALSMTDEETLNMIFLPEFSTSDNVTDISGRGVGMFVVRTSVEDNLKGRVKVETTKGEGTVITLYIPAADEKEQCSNG